MVEISALVGAIGLASSAATFFIGRTTAAKNSGAEDGEMKSDINTINFYDASFACLGQITDSGASYGICVNNGSKFKTKVVNGVSVLDLSNNTVSGVSDIRYVRIGNNIASESPISSGADMIVTVNEEIT